MKKLRNHNARTCQVHSFFTIVSLHTTHLLMIHMLSRSLSLSRSMDGGDYSNCSESKGKCKKKKGFLL